jgi:hypothetical protein
MAIVPPPACAMLSLPISGVFVEHRRRAAAPK